MCLVLKLEAQMVSTLASRVFASASPPDSCCIWPLTLFKNKTVITFEERLTFEKLQLLLPLGIKQ